MMDAHDAQTPAPRSLSAGFIPELSRFIRPVPASQQHPDNRAAHAGGERARQDRAQPERDDFGATLRHHRAHAADQDAETAEIREAAQRIGQDQPRCGLSASGGSFDRST